MCYTALFSQSLFSTDFLHSLFVSYCWLFAVIFCCAWQLVTRCFLFIIRWTLLASRWSVLSSRCFIIISLSSSLAVIWMLYITWCMLFVITKLAAHSYRSLIAVSNPWIVGWLFVTHFFPPSPPSVVVECLIFALRCSLITYPTTCLPLTTFSLMLAVPLKRSAVFQLHIAFRCAVPVSRCSLLAARFFCMLACRSPLFPFLLFVRHPLHDTRWWPRTDYLCFVSLW